MKAADILRKPHERRKALDDSTARNSGGGRRYLHELREFGRIYDGTGRKVERACLRRAVREESGIRCRRTVGCYAVGGKFADAKTGFVIVAIQAPVAAIRRAADGKRSAVVARGRDRKRIHQLPVRIDLAARPGIDEREMNPPANDFRVYFNVWLVVWRTVGIDLICPLAMSLLSPASG